jgi:peptide/nickel transport system permease protein
VVQAGALLTAFVFVLVNLLVDISYAYLDPRIRYR